MGAYFAIRITKVADENDVDAGRTYYSQIFAIKTYKPFQADTDAILAVERPELIVV